MDTPKAQFAEALARARERYHEALPILWNPPNVVGVGVGLRSRAGETIEDEVCFVVYVREKQTDLTGWERLPPEVLEVPVDVQVAGAELPRHGVGIGGLIWGEGREARETGSLGLIARGEDGNHYALTAMHVLYRDEIPLQLRGMPVCAATSQGDERIGVVVDGRLEPYCDIALIRLDRDERLLRDLARCVIRAGEPLRLNDLRPGHRVRLAAGGGPSGRILADLYTGPCRTDQPDDRTRFVNLLRFRFESPLEEGWSGGLIFSEDDERSPVALLSFILGDIGFGWPIRGFYRYWHLSPLG